MKYDEGTMMQAEDSHLELVENEIESGKESDSEMEDSDAPNSDGNTLYEERQCSGVKNWRARRM